MKGKRNCRDTLEWRREAVMKSMRYVRGVVSVLDTASILQRREYALEKELRYVVGVVRRLRERQGRKHALKFIVIG